MDSLLDNLLKIFFANSTKKIWELSITGTYRKAAATTSMNFIGILLHFTIAIDNFQTVTHIVTHSNSV